MTSNEENRKSRVVVEMGTETEPILVRWSTMWGRYSPFESYGLSTKDGWVIIDPEAPDAQGKERLRGLIPEHPIATVLTSDGHERSCYEVREKWGIPVWGPEPRSDPSTRPIAYDGEPDHFYKTGQTLPGGLIPIKLQGSWGGDHAVLWDAPDGQKILFSGDILNGQVELSLAQADHYRLEPGLYFGSRPGYIDRHQDHEALKQSLRDLLQEDFDVICGAHGTPFSDNPKEAIIRLIDSI